MNVILTLILAFLFVAMGEEPQCSKYHYEEQTLRKMLKMELDMERMTTDFTNLKSDFDDKITGYRNSLQESAALLKDMEDKVIRLSNKQSLSTYVRWGREDCPGNGTEMLYKGYMAGNKWDKHGGGTTSLCLPDTPTWAEHIDGYQNGATIYGTEIEIDATVSAKLFGTNLHDDDISCAVCSSVRSSMIMLPGQSRCLPGWAEEYQGYLVASHPNWIGSSDYVCLDGGFSSGQNRRDNEHVIKPVEVQCGSLPCPPYVQGREIACIVCTK